MNYKTLSKYQFLFGKMIHLLVISNKNCRTILSESKVNHMKLKYYEYKCSLYILLKMAQDANTLQALQLLKE